MKSSKTTMKFLIFLVAMVSAEDSCWKSDGVAADAEDGVVFDADNCDATVTTNQWGAAWVAETSGGGATEDVDCDDETDGWESVKDDCVKCANLAACMEQHEDADSVEELEDDATCGDALAAAEALMTGACAFMKGAVSCEDADADANTLTTDLDDASGDCDTAAATTAATVCPAYAECKGYKDAVKAAGDAAADEAPASILALGASLLLMLL
jgi:hypothetical protein